MLHVCVLSFPLSSEFLCGNGQVFAQSTWKKWSLYAEWAFSQDPYFDQLCTRGGCCQNPTIQVCLTCSTLTVQGNIFLTQVRGKSWKRCVFPKEIIDDASLAKTHRCQSLVSIVYIYDATYIVLYIAKFLKKQLKHLFICAICDWIWEKLVSMHTTAGHTFHHHTTAGYID